MTDHYLDTAAEHVTDKMPSGVAVPSPPASRDIKGPQKADGDRCTPEERRSVASIGGILDDVVAFLRMYMHFPSAESAHAVALFAAYTHILEAFDISPYLFIRSPERRCGKSTLLELITMLVGHPKASAGMTAAAMFRSNSDAEAAHHTLIVDELDAVFGKTASESSEAIRAVLNAGNRRSGTFSRVNRASGKVENFDAYGPKVLAGIGTGYIPETVTDRSISISLTRATGDEQAALKRARFRFMTPRGEELHDLLASWGPTAQGEAERMVESAAIGDITLLSARMMDAWEPLLIVAALAGGEWLERAHNSAIALSRDGENNISNSLNRRALVDCFRVFHEDDTTHDHLPGSCIVTRLRALEDAPWEGRGLDASSLAFLLHEYGVKVPGDRRRFPAFGYLNPVAYYSRERFLDAWDRYMTDAEKADFGFREAVDAEPGVPTPTRHMVLAPAQESVFPKGVVPGVPGVPGSVGVTPTNGRSEALVGSLLDALGDSTLTLDADLSGDSAETRDAWGEAVRRFQAREEARP